MRTYLSSSHQCSYFISLEGFNSPNTFPNLFLQTDALERAGCEKVFTDTTSGTIDTRKVRLMRLSFAGKEIHFVFGN